MSKTSTMILEEVIAIIRANQDDRGKTKVIELAMNLIKWHKGKIQNIENSVGVSDAIAEDGVLARDREWHARGENVDSQIASEHVPIGNRIEAKDILPIVGKIKECMETKTGGCGSWCGNMSCSPDCSNEYQYQELNESKVIDVLQQWVK